MQGGGKQAEEKGVGGLVACRLGFVGRWREEGRDTAVQGDGDTNLGQSLPRTLKENCFGFEREEGRVAHQSFDGLHRRAVS